MPTPPREIVISEEVIRRLLAQQRPELADSDILIIGEGWDNVTALVGDGVAVRLPRRDVAAENLVVEQRWLPVIEARLPVAIPVPLWCGEPTNFYPCAWSVVPWFEGDVAARSPLQSAEAPAVAAVLRALHVSAPSDAPDNPYRNRPLEEYAAPMSERLAAVRTRRIDIGLDVADVETMWNESHRTEIDNEATWVHGDLHPKNVITRDGMLVAIIDWGDLTVGDRAVDLSAVWSLFEPEAHDSFWLHYGSATEYTRIRARAWATYLALLWIVDAADGDPLFADMGRRTLARLVA